ncbi:hypothetical protein [Rhodopila globiformis]|uniref:Uncharacterized protein n=1 Tax=Rhodopila globiformis TaxID=1071 RepID=A0A2S6N698_RHOGL|nr:hypothetical protein [Rhodopila globiformis]PPQ30134.1 hypothetical protein CCS01_19740 [Rhodopila globiformis]
MLQAVDRQANDHIARAQLDLFHDLSDRIHLTPDERRRALALSDGDWRAWDNFLADGPLPSWPPLPDMLRHLGNVTFKLLIASDSRTL